MGGSGVQVRVDVDVYVQILPTGRLVRVDAREHAGMISRAVTRGVALSAHDIMRSDPGAVWPYLHMISRAVTRSDGARPAAWYASFTWASTRTSGTPSDAGCGRGLPVAQRGGEQTMCR